MTTDRFFGIALAVLLLVPGCARQQTEENQPVRQESQAERDEAKANQAVTDMNQKIFSNLNARPTTTATTQRSAASGPDQPPPKP